MKRLTLKISNNDQNMMIPVRGQGNLLGYDDDVTSLIETETETSINAETDLEVRRILPASTRSFGFRYWNGVTHVTNLSPIFVGVSAVTTAGYRNSFYLIQLFDSFKDESSSKEHTGYFNGFEFPTNTLSSTYSLGSDKEFTNLYIDESVLGSMSGATKDFYVKFLFYSAKTGKFHSFYNPLVTPITSQERMYWRIAINPNTLTYSFYDATITPFELVNPTYDEFVNNTVESVAVEKPVYPSGNTFDNTGSYITI